jgi:putative ABC transport system permease protein
VLLIGAGLLIKSFLRLQSVELGFQPEGLVAVRMTLPEAKATDPKQIRDFHSRVLDRLKDQTGITNAAIANHIPFGLGNAMEGFRVEGREEGYGAAFRVVTDQYFNTMGIPVILGGGFTGRTNTIFIDATIKKRFWANENPIGKKITIIGLPEVWNIGGVVGTVRSLTVEEDPLPTLYLLSTAARPATASYLVVRTPVDSESLRTSIHQAIREASPDAIIAAPTPVHDLVGQTLAERQFNTWVLGVFAAVALLLAAVGLYSVIGYSVSQRTHEIGIRMALGASASRILLLIVREGFLVAMAGILIGLLFSFTSMQILGSLLYGVNPTDALTFYACGLLFLFVAVLASYFPARRAAMLDPLVALKYE